MAHPFSASRQQPTFSPVICPKWPMGNTLALDLLNVLACQSASRSLTQSRIIWLSPLEPAVAPQRSADKAFLFNFRGNSFVTLHSQNVFCFQLSQGSVSSFDVCDNRRCIYFRKGGFGYFHHNCQPRSIKSDESSSVCQRDVDAGCDRIFRVDCQLRSSWRLH